MQPSLSQQYAQLQQIEQSLLVQKAQISEQAKVNDDQLSAVRNQLVGIKLGIELQKELSAEAVSPPAA